MHMDPLMPALVGTIFAVLLAGILFQQFRLPQVVAYLAVGVCLRPYALAFDFDADTVARLGEFGVVLLLFFLGMEMSVPKLISNWRVTVLGTLVQIGASVGLIFLVGAVLDWTSSRCVLLGFVISLSSTAVVIQLLRDSKEIDRPVGHDVTGILLVQDVTIVPMVITLSLLSGESTDAGSIGLQILGAAAVVGILVYLGKGLPIRLPLGKTLRSNHELQVFAAFALCFGFALLSGLLGLSTAIGAFVAGLVVATARETVWIQHQLEPFRVLLLAFFFVSIGMLLDIAFVREQIVMLALLTLLVLVTNTVISALILRFLGRSWGNSWYGGALLAQIGEFSFVLASVGVSAAVITDFGYQVTISIIAMSLFVAPIWSALFRLVSRRSKAHSHPIQSW